MVSPLLSSINSGEFSPRMEGRIDFERYPNAAKMCRNFLLFPQGGITRRPGSRFVKAVKDQTKSTRVLPFQFSELDAYVHEVGEGYVRPYRRQGQITVDATDAAIVNGTFTSGITSWTNKSTGSAAIAHDTTNHRLQLTGASDGIAWAEQAVTIAAGNVTKEHVLQFAVAGYGGGTVGLRVGSTTGAHDILDEVQLTAGYHAIGFTPGAGHTTFYVQFRNNNSPPRKMYVDDVMFLTDQAMEVKWPYQDADLADIRFFQAADVVYLMHGDYAPRRLERRGHRSWSVAEAAFIDGPYLDTNDGTDVDSKQLIANPLFENKLINWNTSGTNTAVVLYNESGSFAELDPKGGSTLGVATLRSDKATTVNGQKHVAHVLTLAAGPVTVKIGKTSGGVEYINAVSQYPGWQSYEFTSTGTDLYCQFEFGTDNLGRAGVSACQVFNENVRLMQASATTGEVTITARGFPDGKFTSADVGRFLRIAHPGHEPGYGVIIGYTDANTVTMLVLRALASTTPSEDWKMGAWGGDQLYPHVVAFFDGRSVFANTDGRPNSLWLSQSGQLQVMRPDSFTDGDIKIEDDDAISVTLQSTSINPIYWIAGQKQLKVGTAGGQWIITSTGAVVTPTDISAKQHAAVPCSALSDIEINQTILFADRAQHKVHELSYSLQEDAFLATDMTILSDHVLRSKLQEMAYQRNPYSIIYCRRADGRLALLSYNKQHQVLGWSQIILGGSFGDSDPVVESVCTIPGADDSDQTYSSGNRDEVWMVVKRTVDGQTVRYVEFFEGTFDGPLREDYDTELEWQDAMRGAQVDAFFVDCGLSYVGTPITTISNLEHLEGETVHLLADGKVLPDRAVAGGVVTINEAASVIHVGLPYKHRYEGLKLAAETQIGTGANKVKIITQVGCILLDASDFKIATVDYDEDGRRQHDLHDIRMLRDQMDESEAVPLYTGERNDESDGSYSRDARVYIESDVPLPFTLLGLAPQMEVRPT